MKTIYSLIYFECCRQVNDVLSVTNGPFIADNKKELEDRLARYIFDRGVDAFPELLIEFAQEHEIPTNAYFDENGAISDADCESLFQSYPAVFSLDELGPWFDGVANDDDMYFGYRIEAHATQTLESMLYQADAFMIEGQLTDRFSVASVDGILQDDDILLDGMLDPETPFAFSLRDIRDACYVVDDNNHHFWQINGQSIRPIVFK